MTTVEIFYFDDKCEAFKLRRNQAIFFMELLRAGLIFLPTQKSTSRSEWRTTIKALVFQGLCSLIQVFTMEVMSFQQMWHGRNSLCLRYLRDRYSHNYLPFPGKSKLKNSSMVIIVQFLLRMLYSFGLLGWVKQKITTLLHL